MLKDISRLDKCERLQSDGEVEEKNGQGEDEKYLRRTYFNYDTNS